MILLFILPLLTLSFNIRKKSQLDTQKSKAAFQNSINIQKSLLKNIKNHKQILKQSCNLEGNDFGDSPLEFYFCQSGLLNEITFQIDENTEILKMESSNNIQILNCKYISGVDKIDSTLLRFINSNEINIKSFLFDFSNLTSYEYITFPVIDFDGKIQDGETLSQYKASLAITVINAKLGRSTEEPIQYGGIIHSNNYKLIINDTKIEKVNIAADAGDNTYIIKTEKSDLSLATTIEINNSRFIDTGSAKFILNLDDREKLMIKNSFFEKVGDSLFTINSQDAEVRFDFCEFVGSSKENIHPIDTSKWTSSENNFYECKFELIDGTAVVVNGLGIYNFIQCNFWNNTNRISRSSAIIATSEGSILITGCTFINNTGTVSGGALFIKVQNAEITFCEFIDNHCKNLDGVSIGAANGGALYLHELMDFSLTYCI